MILLFVPSLMHMRRVLFSWKCLVISPACYPQNTFVIVPFHSGHPLLFIKKEHSWLVTSNGDRGKKFIGKGEGGGSIIAYFGSN